MRERGCERERMEEKEAGRETLREKEAGREGLERKRLRWKHFHILSSSVSEPL